MRDVSGLEQAVDLASRPFDDPNYEWVDPYVLHIPTCFRGPIALNGFLSEVSILKHDAPSDAVVDDSCNHIVQVCHGLKNVPHDFFFVYICCFQRFTCPPSF